MNELISTRLLVAAFLICVHGISSEIRAVRTFPRSDTRTSELDKIGSGRFWHSNRVFCVI